MDIVLIVVNNLNQYIGMFQSFSAIGIASILSKLI